MQSEITKFKVVDLRNVSDTPQWQLLDSESKLTIQVVGEVLPFRTNQYVMDSLIDWTNLPNDPIFQLVFPQREMLDATDFQSVQRLIKDGDQQALTSEVNRIRRNLNPHPAGQLTHNVPRLE